MAMIYTDGFDSYTSTGSLANRYSLVESGWSWQATEGRTGGGAIQSDGAASGNLLRTQILPFASSGNIGNSTGMTVAFWLKVSAAPATTVVFFRILTSTFTAANDFSLTSSGFLVCVGTSNLIVSLNVCDGEWHYVEVRCAAGAFTAVVDNVTFTGGAVFGPFTVPAVQWQTVLGSVMTIDDVIIYDTVTGYPDQDTDFPIGPQLIHTMRPSADAAVEFSRSGGASNADCVNEVLLDEADFVESAVLDAQDLYDYDGTFPGSPTPARIHTAMVTSQLRDPEVGSVSDVLLCRSGSTQSEGLEVLTPLYRRCRQSSFPLNPETAVAWTPDTLNAAQFGVKVSAT